MAFWLAVLLGALFAWIAVQVGFYAAWILFFNLLASAYMAVFLTPLAVANIPAATTMPYGYGLAMLSIGVMTFAIAYGLSFACLSGRLCMPLPKAFDNVGAGILGFFSGFLTWSLVAMAVSLTPLADFGVCQTLGLNAASQTTNRGYVCWWCNRFHDLVSVAHSTQTSQDAMTALLTKAVPTAVDASSKPVDAASAGDTSPQSPPPPPAPSPPSVAASTGTTTTGSATSTSAGTTTTGSATVVATTAAPTTGAATSTASTGTTTAGTGTATTVGSVTSDKTPEPTASMSSKKTTPEKTATTQPDKKQPDKTQPAESLEAQLASRTAVLQSPETIGTIASDPHVSVLEVSPLCTIDKFTPGSARRLQRWVSDGGLLLVNNNVLGLFAIACEPLADHGPMVCVPAQSHAVVANCRQVVLQTSGQKARILPIGDVVPLLKLEKPGAAGDTVVWSLAPYGNGWVCDAKAVDMGQGDGTRFWRNFCTFCLSLKMKPSAGSATASIAPASPSNGATAAHGPLTGVWKASAGAQFRIADDGKTFSIRLISSDALLMCSGVFTRPSDTKPVKGTLYVILGMDVAAQHSVHVAITIENPNRLRLRCMNWPVINPRTGKYLGRPYVETWERVDEPLFRPGLPAVPEQPSHASEP
ncbi:MAG: hypothetical protein ABFC77_09020 [Thermoguttaceae bacterium]